VSNRETLEKLFSARRIRIRRSGLFDSAPPPPGPAATWAKIEGMMLGLAIGDSLGNTTEGLTAEARRAQYGEIRDYLPNRHVIEPRGMSARA
jgi:hypothetical protein